MSRKQVAPLRLKRPQNYVIQYPQDYKPPKPKPQTQKISFQKKQSKQKPQKSTQHTRKRISRPAINKPVDEKKKYYFPGQKYPTPQQDDGLRIFYQSLLAQKPQSLIALRYCIEHGLLEKDVAQGIIEHQRGSKLLMRKNGNNN